MADQVTSQILENGIGRLAMKFTSLSDGTGESNVRKVDAQSATIGSFLQGQQFVPGTSLVASRVTFDVRGMLLRLLWQAAPNVELLDLVGFGDFFLRDERGGFGVQNPLAPGATGSVLFTTVGATAGASYSVVLGFIKGLQVPQGLGYFELNSRTGRIALNSGGGDMLLNSSS